MVKCLMFMISEHQVFPTVANFGQMGDFISIHLISSHFISFYLNSCHFGSHLRILRFILQLITWSRISIYWVLFLFDQKIFTQNIKYILRLICDVLRNTALSLYTRELKKYMSLWGSNCFKFAHCLTMSQDELRKYLLARKRLTLLALMVKGKCVKRVYTGFSWRKKSEVRQL